MRAHLAYLRYVLLHKWHVFYGCLKMGVPLWRAIMHDASKFSRAEWEPYVRQFYNPDGSKRSVRDATGNYDPNRQSEAFQRAWEHHWTHNPHHWQYWCGGDGSMLSAMPETYIREMIADWYGAGMAISGKREMLKWYEANKTKMILEDTTRRRVEELLDLACRRGLVDAQPGEPDPFYTTK